ncbi:MAG: hypothetical protein OXH07_09950 [Chloroflexi bacterium]|nr:hypothetical protein [Chloroflexota bacterium]
MADTRAKERLTRGSDGAHAREGDGRDAGDLGCLCIGYEPGSEERCKGGDTDEKQVEAGAQGQVAVSMRAGTR